MIQLTHHLTSRTLFIVREGILLRGTIAGVLLTGLYVVANLRNGTFASGFARASLIVVLCFLEWTVGAGLVIGSILWSRRQQAAKRASLHSR